MTAELLDMAQTALTAAGGLPGAAEVYLQHSSNTSIKVYQGEPESVSTSDSRGAGVRYLHEGRQGYAYTSDLSVEGLRQAVLAAADNARASDADPENLLPGPQPAYAEIPGLFRTGVSSTPLDQKIAMAVEAERLALNQADIRTVEQSAYVDGVRRLAIASSNGVRAYGEQTYAFLYLFAHAERDGETESGLGFVGGREPGELTPVTAAEEAVARARQLLGARPCPTGGYRVVLDRQIVAALLGALSQAFQADAVQKGRSLFAGREGQEIASPLLELTDDGLHPDGLDTFPFDDEGVARLHPSVLIHQQKLVGFLYDTRTAARAGRESTGNSSRTSYRSAPSVGTTNLVLANGNGTLEELCARVGNGLYVTEVGGLHSGINPVSGEISVGVKGRMIRDGVVAEPVREATMATDLLSLLSKIDDLAGDARWDYLYGSIFAPSLALGEIAVSGV